jgi:DNA helicase MCM8
MDNLLTPEGEAALKHYWNLYFPFDEYNTPGTEEWALAVRWFRRFFDGSLNGPGHCLISALDLEVATEVVLDYTRLLSLLTEELAGLPDVMKTNALTALACLGLAICSLRSLPAVRDELAPATNKINVRFVNYSPSTGIWQLNASHIGRFVSVRGNATRVTGVTPLIKTMDFLCTKCGEHIRRQVPDGKYEPPEKCDSMGCKSRTFKIERGAVKCVDFQRVRTAMLRCVLLCTYVQLLFPTTTSQAAVGDPAVHANDCRNNNVVYNPTPLRTCYSQRTCNTDTILLVGHLLSNEPSPQTHTHAHTRTHTQQQHTNTHVMHKTPPCDTSQVKLQEMEDEHNSIEPGRVPKSVEIELTEELVERVVPGDVVIVTGTVKALSSESITGRGSRQKGRGRESGLLVLLIEANAIENVSRGGRRPESSGTEPTAGDSNATEDDTSHKSDVVACLTPEDIAQIRHVALVPNCFYDLVHSLCPMIFGHELVKAGLLLALLGGNSNATAAPTPMGPNPCSIRADIHALVVGEPGMGKSQLLQACAAVAPRGVYVSGNTTSTSGLTVTLAKDSNGEFSLEAGALVLADRGVCCIDEFDKLTAEHSALLEAMEQQSISIAKAGIVCTLSSRTSILAAANPKGGTYNRSRTIQENVKLSSALLSRFDLIYILLDNPEVSDDLIAEHVMRMHTSDGQGGLLGHSISHPRLGAGQRGRSASTSNDMQSSRRRLVDDDENDEEPLRVRLKATDTEGAPLLSPSGLRKYIAYAKHYCHPKLSREACAVLQCFYLQLRKRGSDVDSTPITNRQLESLIRLSAARAKAELREYVTAQDAKDVVSLVEDTLADVYTDEHGMVDLQRSAGLSMNKQKKKLIDRLHRVSDQRHDAFFTMAQLKEEAGRAGLQVGPDFYDLIATLNDQCFFLKKPGGYLLQQNSHTATSSTAPSQGAGRGGTRSGGVSGTGGGRR